MKPLRPFPLPLNIGTDICQISRIYAILAGPRRARFVGRVLSPEEQQSRRGLEATIRARREQHNGDSSALTGGSLPGHEELVRRDPELWKTAAFVAGRFAAKEAAIKAHSHRRLTFHDIIIERRGDGAERLGSGPPVARIRGEGGEDDVSAMVSISHDGDYATAVCMAHDPSVVGEGGGGEGAR